MRNPLNLLILVGLICQGYSWSEQGLTVALTIIWVCCTKWGWHTRVVKQEVEALIVLVAFLAIKLVSGEIGYGHNKLIFLGGNVLLLYQIIRLLFFSTLRQKKLSLLVAVMHIGIGTQVIFDYKIFIVLVASIVLIPKALFAIESEKFRQENSRSHNLPFGKVCASIVVFSIIFFLLFPRIGFQTRGTAAFGRGGGQGPLSRNLDMSGSAGAASENIIFQIEGTDIGYLKCFALDVFDGTHWTASHWMKKQDRKWREPDELESRYRSVKIFNYKLLENYLPIDGFVDTLKGKYYNRPYISGDGGVKVSFPFRRNLSYVYWSRMRERNHQLDEKERQRYLQVPDVSEQLHTWLESVVENQPDDTGVVSTLATLFQTEFRYRLGAPDLSRINTLDDFLFTAKEGHCERFASALAVLLRLRNIPSRVAIGYIPAEKNELGEFYNVRAKHAHAWTEAYFEDQGWTIIDGTPNGRGIERESKTLALTFVEWVEFVWYSKIIEFDSNEQQLLISYVSTHLKSLMGTKLNFSIIGIVIFTLLTGYALRHLKWNAIIAKLTASSKKNKKMDVVAARHFYDQLIRILSKEDLVRDRHQTPGEFLTALTVRQHPSIAEIKFITDAFCAIRYGENKLTQELQKKVNESIVKIRENCRS